MAGKSVRVRKSEIVAPRQSRKSELFFKGKALPKVELAGNVFDAALNRIRWIYDEFPGQITVSTSGGKDSTVTLELAVMVAREKGRLPVRAMWLDQETEFETTVSYQRYLAYERKDEIDFAWYQVPFLMENSTNNTDPWLKVWDVDLPEDQWMRPKEPGAITENTYGEDKFHELLGAIAGADVPEDGAILDGIRSEESPARRLLCTSIPQYKWTTWSNGDGDPKLTGKPGSNRWRFHPVYDWSYRDVWKAIYENGWPYNEHYDHMFQYGIANRSMRVSNFHHEGALGSLHWLQEVEPETWEKATRRLEGISTYGHLKGDQYLTALPYMFASWDEYANYLIDNLTAQEKDRERFRYHYRRLRNAFPDDNLDDLARFMAHAVVGGDLYGTAIDNFMVTHRARRRRRDGTSRLDGRQTRT